MTKWEWFWHRLMMKLKGRHYWENDQFPPPGEYGRIKGQMGALCAADGHMVYPAGSLPPRMARRIMRDANSGVLSMAHAGPREGPHKAKGA